VLFVFFIFKLLVVKMSVEVLACLEGEFGPPDATAIPSALFCYSLAHGLPYWCQLTQVVLKKRLF